MGKFPHRRFQPYTVYTIKKSPQKVIISRVINYDQTDKSIKMSTRSDMCDYYCKSITRRSYNVVKVKDFVCSLPVGLHPIAIL